MKRCLIILLLLFKISSTSASDISVITSKAGDLTISKYEVRQLFLMKRKRLNSGELTILVQMNPNSYLHKKFVREVLDMSVEQYNQIVDSTNNSGYNSYNIIVNTKEEMIKRVSEIQNSIGYIDNDFIIINSLNTAINVYKIVD